MKKVLFGIIALSMAAFAANPGDLSSGTASVPVRVIAEVVKPASSLIITDEAGTILDELLLDHKIVGGTNPADSVVPKNFKVKVTNAGGAVDTSVNSTGDNYKVKIILSKTDTTLTRVGTNLVVDNPETPDQITSTLRLVNGVDKVDSNEYIAPLSEGEHLGTITSTIAAAQISKVQAGAYDNKTEAANMPTLSVTYSASGAFTK